MKKTFILIFLVIVISYVSSMIYFFNKVPNNIEVLSEPLKVTTYSKAKEQVQSILDSTNFEITDSKLGTKTLTLSELGVFISPKFDEILKEYDGNFIWYNFKADDLTSKLIDYSDSAITSTLKKIAHDNKLDKPAKDATITFENDAFLATKEKISTSIDIPLLAAQTITSLKEQNYTVSTDEFYFKPSITQESLKDDIELLNNIINKDYKIVFGDDTYVPSLLQVANYIYIEDNQEYYIDTKQIDSDLTNLTKQYDKIAYSDSQRISDIFYIENAGELMNTQMLDPNVDTVTYESKHENKTTNLVQKASASEDTYVEVNIESQHLWFYKDKKLVLSSPVVTGDVENEWETPKGKYKLYSKNEDQVLDGSTVGFDYMVPVDYWMPFNGGVGFHDTPNRSYEEYGSDTYLKGGGSHGCVNMPPNLAKKLYENLDLKTVVYVT